MTKKAALTCSQTHIHLKAIEHDIFYLVSPLNLMEIRHNLLANQVELEMLSRMVKFGNLSECTHQPSRVINVIQNGQVWFGIFNYASSIVVPINYQLADLILLSTQVLCHEFSGRKHFRGFLIVNSPISLFSSVRHLYSFLL